MVLAKGATSSPKIIVFKNCIFDLHLSKSCQLSLIKWKAVKPGSASFNQQSQGETQQKSCVQIWASDCTQIQNYHKVYLYKIRLLGFNPNAHRHIMKTSVYAVSVCLCEHLLLLISKWNAHSKRCARTHRYSTCVKERKHLVQCNPLTPSIVNFMMY